MAKLAYGVWDGMAYDNRNGGETGPADLDLSTFDNFNPGNPARAFFSHRGFLIFDERAPLLWALWKHMEKVATESCGKCSPCRTGAPLLRDILAQALAGRPTDWEEARDLADQMAQTSLCGVGQTGPRPLLEALSHFVEDFVPGKTSASGGFYATLTSPCIEACPGIVNIPRYIDYIRDGHDDLAANTVLRHYPLVGSCGRVCVRSCESACQRANVDKPVSIRTLKRYAADRAIASNMLKPEKSRLYKQQRVAVIGAGPVGLTCAYHLLDRGYPVDIFEAKDKAGGMIRYGIPIYRLPKETLGHETAIVEEMGAKIFYNRKLGRDFDIDQLFERGYEAVFISCGCPEGSYLGMEDEDTGLPEYENGIEFLERVYNAVEAGNPPTLDGDVLVVGGGNVAMDCCRAACRIATGTTHLVYRRTEADAPADREEIEAAMAEGVVFHFLCGQDGIVMENGRIAGLRVLDMEQTEPDASGRRGVKPVPGSEKIIPCNYIIAAIGQKTDKSMLQDREGVERDRKNCIRIDSMQRTSRPGVFAGGDCTTGPRASGPTTMIMGMGQAYFAANAIDQYLSGGQTQFDSRWRLSEWIAANKLLGHEEQKLRKPSQERVKVRELHPDERRTNFDEVEHTIGREEAWKEAQRCMRCYRVFSVLTEEPIPGN